MKIGIDLDGCVYDFTGSFITYMREEVLYDGPLPIPHKWNTWECWGMDFDVWKTHFRNGVKAGVVFRVGEPIEGSLEVLRTLRAQGHTIHIMTHRDNHPRAIQSTWEWLNEYGVPFDSLTFTKDKTTVAVDYYIDDNVDNYESVARTIGDRCVLFTQPWNEYATDANRIIEWWEFAYQIATETAVAA